MRFLHKIVIIFSICRALANQVAGERAQISGDRISYLVEVNTAALFSKYFSESAKSITKIFGHVATLSAQEDTELIFILLDEVETIAVSRSQVSRAGENMETLRSVNTVLTQLDGLMKLRNVFVLATTNLLGEPRQRSESPLCRFRRLRVPRPGGLPGRCTATGTGGS